MSMNSATCNKKGYNVGEYLMFSDVSDNWSNDVRNGDVNYSSDSRYFYLMQPDFLQPLLSIIIEVICERCLV